MMNDELMSRITPLGWSRQPAPRKSQLQCAIPVLRAVSYWRADFTGDWLGY